MTPAKVGALCALVTFVLDQASKLWLLFRADLPNREPIVLAPFVELVAVWNRGISYGLFQISGDAWRMVLIAGSLGAAALLGVGIWRAQSRFLAAALGLIAGGAVGNAVDRIAYGAVFDFVHFHVGSFSWYVFNVADAAIVAGVATLLYDSLLGERGSGARQRKSR
ncbi:signal peptidase II [Chelatococcus reniformis]|uniref:Lipoprotein signal peptidase n=1 Tax=Chelatococcus reniformis TaxID=1494448 RepID=A0A916XF44_9HYPH|nr:signal peptidase II [Chelatococcus reniformis]GGC67342.1 lipoprotein signal peptidase [Chelatococcus reniformis]